MEVYEYVLIALAAIVVILLAVVLIRTARFKPEKEAPLDVLEVKVDEKRATETLQAMIRCKTVSYYEKSKEDNAEFEKLEALLPELFPAVYATCTLIRPSDRSIILHWKGKDSSKCRILMAHYDVVPVEEELWSKPAFEGILEKDTLWGRGTLDTKGTLNAALTAAEQMIKEGFVPENDIYFAFAGDEEVNGYGAPENVKWFLSQGLRAEMICDEGGAVVADVFPGVKERSALIGIAEKGLMNLEFSIKGKGGHASAPPAHTSVGILSKACKAVEDHPFPSTISKAAGEMFDTLGRRSTFVYRMIFANLWLFKGVLDGICKKSGGELNALMRTSVAFTQMYGSKAPNVIPPAASMVANLRLMSGETVQGAVDYIKKLVPEEVELKVLYGMDPSSVSRTDTMEWQKMKNAVKGTWDNCLVSPYLMLACSDSRHYDVLSDCVYRFSAMALSKEERGMIHGNDERIPVKTISSAVAFYVRLISQC